MLKAPAGIAFWLLLFSVELPAQQVADQTPEIREAQYVALQAGLFDEQTLAALPGTATRIARMLRDIRSRFPAVESLRVPTQMTMNTSVIVGLGPLFRLKLNSLCTGWSGYSQARQATMDIPELDAITERFSGSYEVTCQGPGASLGAYVVVNFPRPLHVPSLTRMYSAAAGVTSAQHNQVLVGGVMPVAVKEEDGQWRFTFGLGAGDCPAGCTYREYHHFLVAADSTIQYLGKEQEGQLLVPVLPSDPESALP